MRHVWGWVLAGGLILGGASAAQAQLSVVVGSPYSGTGAVMVNRPAVGYGNGGYGYGGYGAPGYVNPGYSNFGYSSGYGGFSPYAQQSTNYYNPGYLGGGGVLATSNNYATILPQPVYSTGYYRAPAVIYPARPTYVVRPNQFRPLRRGGFYR